MINILFVCHGNICRSPTAEFLMKEIVRIAGMEEEFNIASAATSTEELGCGVYPPSRRMLSAYGIDCSAKRARQVRESDYAEFDYIIGMDSANRFSLLRRYKGDAEKKIFNLLDFAGREGQEVADPWYTGQFELTWRDVAEGCCALFRKLTGITVLDFSLCRDRKDFYAELRRKMAWESWYGENLDALYDCLTAITEETLLIFTGWDTMQGKLGRYASGTRRALVAADRRNGRLTVQFL